MGTRGLLAFAHDGEIKGAYNHFDSYPSGLGADVAKYVHQLVRLGGDEGLESAKAKFKALVAVDEDEKPTEDQKLALLRYYSPRVSTGSADEWYALLRDTQGDPQAFLDAGFYIDGIGFAQDSLFCEWGYVIDLDRKVVEIYKGFQNAPHAVGRFATGDEKVEPGYAGAALYYPIRLVHTVDFTTLALNPNYMNDDLEQVLDPDEDEDAK